MVFKIVFLTLASIICLSEGLYLPMNYLKHDDKRIAEKTSDAYKKPEYDYLKPELYRKIIKVPPFQSFIKKHWKPAVELMRYEGHKHQKTVDNQMKVPNKSVKMLEDSSSSVKAAPVKASPESRNVMNNVLLVHSNSSRASRGNGEKTVENKID